MVVWDHQRHRPKNLPAGAARMEDNAGGYVHVEGGKITVVAPTKVVTSPEVALPGKPAVAGDIGTTAVGVDAQATTLKKHQHPNTQPGGDQSGTPAA